MKILDVGEPFDCSDLMYEIYVIVDKALPCLPIENDFIVRNPNVIGFDWYNMSKVAVTEVIGNMVRLCVWNFFEIRPGQFIEAVTPGTYSFSEHLQHEITRSVCLG